MDGFSAEQRQEYLGLRDRGGLDVEGVAIEHDEIGFQSPARLRVVRRGGATGSR